MSRKEDEEWRELIEDAPDDFKPKKKREPGKITLPRLKFMEKPFDENEA